MDITPHSPMTKSLSFWLLRTANAIRLHHNDALSGLDITLNQYLVMKAIAAKGLTQPSTIGKILGVNPSDTTRVTQKLETKEILKRSRSHTDRRAVFLQLTRQGASLLKVADGRINAADHLISDSLTPNLVQELQNSLQEILRNCDRWDLEDI